MKKIILSKTNPNLDKKKRQIFKTNRAGTSKGIKNVSYHLFKYSMKAFEWIKICDLLVDKPVVDLMKQNEK